MRDGERGLNVLSYVTVLKLNTVMSLIKLPSELSPVFQADVFTLPSIFKSPVTGKELFTQRLHRDTKITSRKLAIKIGDTIASNLMRIMLY